MVMISLKKLGNYNDNLKEINQYLLVSEFVGSI